MMSSDTFSAMPGAMRRVRAKLVKLSACTCGFPLLHDEIPLGAEYIAWPDWTMDDVSLFCGGCHKTTTHHCVYFEGRVHGGYLPAVCFELEEEPWEG